MALNKVTLKTELCIVGGGIAGLNAAITASRLGTKVVLVQERPVFGGNASGEIRMWICGAQDYTYKETGINEEINLSNYYSLPLPLFKKYKKSVFSEHIHCLFTHLQSDYMGLCFDSGHEHAFTPNEDYLALYGNRLKAMHLHDNDGKSDSHRIPFFGNIDWVKKVKELNSCHYFSDRITLECTIDEYKSLSDGFEKAYDSARRLCELSDSVKKATG